MSVKARSLIEPSLWRVGRVCRLRLLPWPNWALRAVNWACLNAHLKKCLIKTFRTKNPLYGGNSRVRKECLNLLIFNYSKIEVRDIHDNHFRWYAPPTTTSRTRKGPSQLDYNFSSFFLASLLILQTRSPFWKFLGRTLVFYRLAAQSLHTISWILLLSRSLLSRSIPILIDRLSWFSDKSKSCLLRVGLPTSTGIMISVS